MNRRGFLKSGIGTVLLLAVPISHGQQKTVHVKATRQIDFFGLVETIEFDTIRPIDGCVGDIITSTDTSTGISNKFTITEIT